MPTVAACSLRCDRGDLMRRGLTVRRAVPMVGTLMLLGAVALEYATAGLPVAIAIAEGALLLVAMLSSVVTLRLRRDRRVLSRSQLLLLQSLFSNAVATTALLIAAPWLGHPVPMFFAVYLAVLLTVNPAAAGWVLMIHLAVSASGLAAVWWRAGLVGQQGALSIVIAEVFLVGIALVTYANWTLLDSHADLQTRRLTALATTALELGLARDLDQVAAAVLSTCRTAYPNAGWGGIVLYDERQQILRPMLTHLTPAGVARSASSSVALVPEEGITGLTFVTGRPCVLRTAQEIAALYAGSTPASKPRIDFRRWGGGSAAGSFIAAPLRAPDGRVTGVLILNSAHERVWDIGDIPVIQGMADEAAVAIERARLFEEQERSASTDPLTGLPNRRALEHELSTPRGATFSLLAIDIDNLKSINDFYGHEAGDTHLRCVGAALDAAKRANDVLARSGGDEFAMLLPSTTLEEAVTVGDRLCRMMHGVAVSHGQARISVGCAAGAPGADAVAVLAAADEALYVAKRDGRDRVAVARERSPATRAESLAHWEPILRALEESPRIVAAYQPIVALDDRRVHGYEALARLSELPDASVEGLFTAAQRLGMHRGLDWMCRRVALQGAQHLPSGRPLFINVSAGALLDPLHDVDQLLLLMRWAGRDPACIVLEITEREAVRDLERLADVLAAYREHGIRFALDDVGEGFSTFELLAAADPEYVKISMALTQRVGRGPEGAIRSLVAFAGTTGTQLIAEGIESEALVERMHRLGVSLGQGYALGSPQLAGRRDPVLAAART